MKNRYIAGLAILGIFIGGFLSAVAYTVLMGPGINNIMSLFAGFLIFGGVIAFTIAVLRKILS
jgi:hypothetical protein